ncbi:MAG: hypothetical protein FWD61_18355 [Phycisphaerales bacterium]|nr:hypothetical protein [Phycisphaerales bacterium]
MAKDNGWGYTRILGKLRELGIRKICRTMMISILKENGLDIDPCCPGCCPERST